MACKTTLLYKPFTYTRTSTVLTSTLSVIDTTTAGTVSAGLILMKAVDKAADKAAAQAGETVTYTLSYQNNSNAAISTMVINDATPAYTNYLAASCVLPLPAALTSCIITNTPVVGGVGNIQ